MLNFLDFWGKAQPLKDAQTNGHPIWAHSLDVAAVVERLLASSRVRHARLSDALSLSENNTSSLLTWLAAVHDIGKFSIAFQSLVPAAWPAAILGQDVPVFRKRPRHDVIGLWLWEEGLGADLTERVWPVATTQVKRMRTVPSRRTIITSRSPLIRP
jgi:CRISPR-associated endonuclease/helicase Cas3